mgnify:CR=1 FL=1
MRLIIYVMLLLYPFSLLPAASGGKKEKNLSDEELMTLVQKQTFRYFWDYGHPVSGLARERSNGNDDIVTIGGSGFGVMAIIVGAERGFVTREQAAERMLKIVSFLNDKNTDSYHGIWAHWINGQNGETISFSRKDDGADLVESAFMFEGLLAAHQYFNKDNQVERRIRGLINDLWRQAEWNWFTKGGEDVLYWHWSPNNGWSMNHQIKGHNECHITYILAASSPTYPIAESVYHKGWANSIVFKNGKKYYDITLPLGSDYGGPLFFTHYSYMGLDPRGLKDYYADYEEQMKAHTLINRAYCIDNPKGYKGYGEQCWGLTASEMECLFSCGRDLYENADKKRKLLGSYTKKCAHNISGNTVIVRIDEIVRNLREKAEWMMENIRKNEWITDGGDGWFNGYYDDHKNPVECCEKDRVRMMLTSQVFAIMSGTATKEQTAAISRSADKYLFDEKAGGYRLNTNFREEKFDLGRMFGFAYGEKENIFR